MRNSRTKEQFISEIINILQGICMRKGIDAQIEIHTPLFESKLLDSLAFMEFLTALEVDLDVNVPDHKMSIQFFQTPDCIATHFFSTNNSPS